jgi:hypothetical protein
MSNRVKSPRRNLTCEHDNDAAIAVCGECGKPLCSDHQHTLTDASFSAYRSNNTRLLVGLVSLVVVPALFLTVLGDPITNIEESIFGQPIGLDIGFIIAGIIVGLGSLLSVWYQGGDKKTSSRFLLRRPPERSLCEDCYQDTTMYRLLSVAALGTGLLLALGGLILTFQSQSGLLLTLSGLGIALYLLRYDLALYVLGPN